MSIAEQNAQEQRETIERATSILCHLLEEYQDTLGAVETQKLARSAAEKILESADVITLGGCPLCQG